MNGGTGEPSTAVVNVLVDIDYPTQGCDSGLGVVRKTCFGPNKAAATDPGNRSDPPTLPTCIILPRTYHGLLGLGSAQTDKSQSGRIRKRTRDNMVSMSCEKYVLDARG